MRTELPRNSCSDPKTSTPEKMLEHALGNLSRSLTKEVDRRRDSEQLTASSVNHDEDLFLGACNTVDYLPDAKSDFFDDLSFFSIVEDPISPLDEQDKKIFSIRVLADKRIEEVSKEQNCAISTINYCMEKKIIPTIR